MASRVLCASLAVPIPASRNTIDQLLETDEATMEKKRRLATLLMLTTAPTRQTLIKELVCTCVREGGVLSTAPDSDSDQGTSVSVYLSSQCLGLIY